MHACLDLYHCAPQKSAQVSTTYNQKADGDQPSITPHTPRTIASQYNRPHRQTRRHGSPPAPPAALPLSQPASLASTGSGRAPGPSLTRLTSTFPTYHLKLRLHTSECRCTSAPLCKQPAFRFATACTQRRTQCSTCFPFFYPVRRWTSPRNATTRTARRIDLSGC